MDQLIELALKMPPFVSALLSLLVLLVIWKMGRKLFTELELIKAQTTKTNGSVTSLNTWRAAHDKQDDERHAEIGVKHEENKERFDVVVEKQEEMDRKLDRLIEAKGGL